MKALRIYAGPKARAWVQGNGLKAEDIGVVAAAAGGPKGLILGPLDRLIFGRWLPQSQQPVDLIGASIGAWRMATACTPEPFHAFARFEHDYLHQSFEEQPRAGQSRANMISQRFREGLDAFFKDDILAIVHHPRYRLHVVTSRGRHVLRRERKVLTAAAFALAFTSNVVHRRAMGAWLERVVFSTGQGVLPFHPDGYPTRQLALTPTNFTDAVQASCAIPFALEAVHNPEGAPVGAYWDGGLVDYHLHLRYQPSSPTVASSPSGGLVLYPHFQREVIPGWLDKGLKWRHGATPALDNMLLLAPSPEWVASLPRQKLPDRTDFRAFDGNPQARFATWQKACDAARQLADEFEAWLLNPDPSVLQAL
jgi:hypothetical protein